jgi:Ni/Fe-hydrogenase subunit HybB-like protein
LSDILPIGFELDHRYVEVNMSSISSIGLSELVILSGVIGMACGALLVGSIVIAALVFRRRTAYPVEEE